MGTMFRLRILIATLLLVLVGCGSQGAAPTSETSAQSGASANQRAPVAFATSTTMIIPTSEPWPTPEATHEGDLSDQPFILRDRDLDFKCSFNTDYPGVIARVRDEDLQGFRCTQIYFDMNAIDDL